MLHYRKKCRKSSFPFFSRQMMTMTKWWTYSQEFCTKKWFTLYLDYCVPACTNQQAPLCQRYSPVQTGSEGVLQADQRSVNNFRLRIQELPTGGVKGNVHFSTRSQKSHCEAQFWMDDCFHFRNMKKSSTKPQPSERSTNSSSDTSQRSVAD